MNTDAIVNHADAGQLREEFGTEHPDCTAVEIWRYADGRSSLIRIECGTPTQHSPATHFHR